MKQNEIIKVIVATLGKIEFAERMGISIYKLNAKINEPELFTLAEWQRISEIYEQVKELPVK